MQIPWRRGWRNAVVGVALGILGLAGCGGGNNDITAVEEVTSVRVTVPGGGSAAVVVGQGLQLQAVALNRNGAAVAGKTVQWESGSPAVATVSQSGLVTGVRAGSVSITASVDDHTGSAAVQVEAALVVATSALPEATHTMPYNAGLQASGGTGAVTWSVAPGSSAPPGLTVQAGGAVTGSPALAGTFPFVVRAASGTQVVDRGLQLVVRSVVLAKAPGTNGDQQSGPPATALPQALRVWVVNSSNTPLANVAVQWAVTEGGGNLAAAATATNAQGEASVSWTLGGVGPQAATASVAGAQGSPVTFTATAAANRLIIVSGDGQTGPPNALLPQSLRVRVMTSTGAPVGGQAVQWTVTHGGGNLAAAATATNAQGEASVSWTLGGVGPQAATGSVVGAQGSPVTFSATAAVPIPAFQFVLIPAGTFSMGSTTGFGPVHTVTLTRAFHLQTTEVTQAQWQAVMGTNPSFFAGCGSTCPVEAVSWDDVQQFLTVLNQRDPGKGYRLPTEAEWEYAARAGTTGDYGGTGVLDQMGWYGDNSGGSPHPVGQKLPNAWGLYDMHGNVWEWVQDWYAATYYSVSPGVDPPGPAVGSSRVLRGGSWGSSAVSARSANRDNSHPSGRSYDVGFRLARTP